MTTIQATEPIIRRAATVLDQYAASINEAHRAREKLLADTVTGLNAAGFETRIIRRWGDARNDAVGDIVGVVERFERWGHDLERQGRFVYPTAHIREGVSYFTFQKPIPTVSLSIYHGPHRVMLVDEDDLLVAKDPDLEAGAAHRRSVARLRTLARHDSLRVRGHGLDIALIDPLDNVVHEGDVASAFAWILGIDLNTPVAA